MLITSLFVYSYIYLFYLFTFILNRSSNSQISIEIYSPQQAGGFMIKRCIGTSNIAPCIQITFHFGTLSNNRCPIMCHCAKTCASLLAFFPITFSKSQTFNWVQSESLKMTNKLCTLCLSLKPYTSPSPVLMVKSHGKKYQYYFRVTSSTVSVISRKG